MATFNFDGDEHRISIKIPAIKALNIDAKLWIAYENCENSKWRKDCIETCSSDCIEHYATLVHRDILSSSYDDNGDLINIKGGIITNPNMLIIQRSPLLKINKNTNRVEGEWRKNENRDEFICVRRYLIMFVDENKSFLHEDPIQLTAKGCFQVEFDKKYLEFRKDFATAYSSANKKSFSNMSDIWYAMCIFIPNFESEVVGPSRDKKSKACITKSFQTLTKTNYKDYCMAMNPENAKIIQEKHKSTEKWWNKSITKSKQIELELEDEENNSIIF
ncbi:hypothetical protein AGMMS49579_01390 [Spirochaetia bacterium]|nr:hypothetical protein AGMMS49579_01390 [Spirochaetia bacterium]